MTGRNAAMWSSTIIWWIKQGKTYTLLYENNTNEWYAKDTSKKIRAVFKAKGEAGKSLCTNPPYGYIKDPQDKLHWSVEETAADVVKRIFKLCIEGYDPSQIANILEQRCCSLQIRNMVIEEILLSHLKGVTAYARDYEAEFIQMITKSSVKAAEKEIRDSHKKYEQAKSGIAKLDTIIQKALRGQCGRQNQR